MTDPSIVQIPVIETGRTVLRAHRYDDFETYALMWADPAVTRFIGGQPRSREDSWLRFLRHAGMWSMLGYGFWAVEDKETGGFIGEAGFHDLKRDMTPSIEGVPESGWAMAGAVQGKGLATEIVAAIHRWGDAHFGGWRTVCIIDPVNTASIRVAEKCGYRQIDTATYKDAPTLLFERSGSNAGA